MNPTPKPPQRQIGFKPNAVRLAPTQPGSNGADPKIRQLSLQLQQLQTRQRMQEERLIQLKVPSMRQTLEAQLQASRKEVMLVVKQLQELRAPARIERLKALAPDDDLAESLRRLLAELDAIYRVHQPLPASLMPPLEAWLGALRGLHERLRAGKPVETESLEAQAALMQAFARELAASEHAQLENLLKAFTERMPVEAEPEALIEAAEAPPAPGGDFELLSFEDQGPLELSFDLSQRKATVRNQMGITLNQNKKTYQEYLEEGFSAIDITVASQFSDREPLYRAVESFLEGISLDRSRYEAYFGLGYLYSLVKDLNHALYFLDLAWRISGDEAIKEMMDRVKTACSPPRPIPVHRAG